MIAPQRLPVPVIVVGGATVGGSGKTPLTLWLVEALRKHGYRPGIVSRGYGGEVLGVAEVKTCSEPRMVGDEPLLLKKRADCPVFVGADRVAAGRALLAAHPQTNLILSDDGLQHYRLARDMEIVVLDRRGLGNGWQLPAGPLREPAARLREVDALVLNDASAPHVLPSRVFHMQLQGAQFYRLDAPQVTADAKSLPSGPRYAIAGIGEPQRFFDHLSALGLTFAAHAFPDHHAYSSEDFSIDDGIILTTEKDAVKLRECLSPKVSIWVLPVTAILADGLDQLIVEKLNGRAPA
jgi:tetraacyldisaccharide 4'-kinase